MTYEAYIPKAGSLAEGVINFLMENPDEELTTTDIAIKFDRLLNTITPGLRTAVYWKHLTLDVGDQHRPSVYRLGPARRQMLDNAPLQLETTRSGGSASNELCSFQGQGLKVSRMPGCLRVSSGPQVLDLSAAQVSTLALIGPVLMGQAIR